MGERSAVAAAVRDAVPELSEAEQLDMLPVATRISETRQAQAVEAVRQDRRRGRPAGARNLATREMLDFVRAQLGDPVYQRARWAMHTPESLAAVLGCTKLEAFDRLDRIRSELSRLFYAPLAPVDAQGHAVVPQFLMSIGGAPQGSGPDRPPWDYLVEMTEQNGEAPKPAAPVSHAPVSHEDDK